MTKTEHYQLNQWDPSDQVRRTDFNEDNTKIEQALAGQADALEAAEAQGGRLQAAASNLAHMLHILMEKSYEEDRANGIHPAFFMDEFTTDDYVASMTGNLQIQAGTLQLPWGSEPATMTTVPISLPSSAWSRAQVWIKVNEGAGYAVTVNGQPMTPRGSRPSQSSAGTECAEIELTADLPGCTSVVFTFTLTEGDGEMARIFEYAAMFF